MADSCEHGADSSDLVKFEEFFGQIPKKDCYMELVNMYTILI